MTDTPTPSPSSVDAGRLEEIRRIDARGVELCDSVTLREYTDAVRDLLAMVDLRDEEVARLKGERDEMRAEVESAEFDMKRWKATAGVEAGAFEHEKKLRLAAEARLEEMRGALSKCITWMDSREKMGAGERITDRARSVLVANKLAPSASSPAPSGRGETVSDAIQLCRRDPAYLGVANVLLDQDREIRRQASALAGARDAALEEAIKELVRQGWDGAHTSPVGIVRALKSTAEKKR